MYKHVSADSPSELVKKMNRRAKDGYVLVESLGPTRIWKFNVIMEKKECLDDL